VEKSAGDRLSIRDNAFWRAYGFDSFSNYSCIYYMRIFRTEVLSVTISVDEFRARALVKAGWAAGKIS
jgi:hypothetical protein